MRDSRKKNKKIAYSICAIVLVVAVVLASAITHNNAKAAEGEEIRFFIDSAMMADATRRCKTEAIYKTEYFSKSGTEYNNGLAILSASLALASASTSESYATLYGSEMVDVAYTDYGDVDPYTARNANMVKAYQDMGFEKDVYFKYTTPLNDKSDTVAYAMATKKIKISGKSYNLVNVTVRSGSYGAEWGSNFMLSNEKGYTGFQNASIELYDNLKKYLTKNKLNKSNTKVWIAGLSRGGAIANLAGASLDRACEDKVLNINKANVYVYTCATPHCIYDDKTYDMHSSLYDNIHNVVINTDIVPTTITSAWGYDRYGKVYTIESPHISGKDLERIEKGKKVDIDEDTVELVKNISRTVNECLYYYEDDYDMNKLYPGFTVKKDFAEAVDIAFGVFGDKTQDYVDRWQNVVTDMIPFAIGMTKKYDSEEKVWKTYDSIAEYISLNYDEGCIKNAIDAGVFSQTEYISNMDKIDKIYKKGTVNEEAYRILVKALDTYYGIKILAIHYDIDVEMIAEAVNRAVDRAWPMIQRCLPIGDTLNFKYNHYGEFYLSWLKCYNPATKEVYEYK